MKCVLRGHPQKTSSQGRWCGGGRLPEDDERQVRGDWGFNIDDVITKNTRI